MWRFLAGAVVMSVATIVALSTQAPTALACSAGPDFDPVASSDVIVEGRILGYEVLPDAPLGDDTGHDFTQDPYIPVRIDMAVERVLKGDYGQAILAIVDARTLRPPLGNREDYEWIGSAGACGAFNDDPTDVYAILGLTERDDGTFSPNLLRVFYLGDGPAGDAYDAAFERMASFPGAAELPALGSGPGTGGGTPTVPIALAIAGAALTLGAGVAWAAVQRRRSS